MYLIFCSFEHVLYIASHSAPTYPVLNGRRIIYCGTFTIAKKCSYRWLGHFFLNLFELNAILMGCCLYVLLISLRARRFLCGYLTFSFYILLYFHIRRVSATARITTGPRRCSFPPNVRRRAKLFSRHFNGSCVLYNAVAQLLV